MEKKNKKTLIILFILLVIFIFTLARALKPVKPRTITVTQGEGKQEIIPVGEKPSYKEEVFDFQQIDMSVSKLQSIAKSLEQQEEQFVVIETKKNPFQVKSSVIAGKSPDTVSILRQDYVEAPDFRISGIVYDRYKPMVIIDDEIKAESETKDGYTIKKILADRIILRRENKEFVLHIGSDNNTISGAINISDSTDLGDTGIFTGGNKIQNIFSESSDSSVQKSFVKESDSIINTVTEPKDNELSLLAQQHYKKALTIQIASFGANKRKQAIEFAKKITDDGYQSVRVEFVDGMYTVRAGIAKDKEDLIPLCEELKKYSETSFIRTAYVIHTRIVYPPLTNITLDM